MMIKSIITIATCTVLASGFSSIQLQQKITSKSQLQAAEQSRRDIFTNTASIAAVGLSTLIMNPNDAEALNLRTGPIVAQSAANKANESYQGVWSDPMHPNGYRIIMATKGKDGSAMMEISDGPDDKNDIGVVEAATFKNIPIGIKGNEFSFDFGFKGGPKGVIATLSDDKKTLTFPDGNSWVKNQKQYDGIYKDPAFPNGYRIVRKYKGSNTITEINDTGNPKDSIFVKGKHASLASIPTTAMTFTDYKVKDTKKATNIVQYAIDKRDTSGNEYVGQLSLDDKNSVFFYGTITFPDGVVWTRI